jgi:putative ubiquitin-RnfH superfamily antitoxin RatB of RatAB toxin-antitoxin module
MAGSMTACRQGVGEEAERVLYVDPKAARRRRSSVDSLETGILQWEKLKHRRPQSKTGNQLGKLQTLHLHVWCQRVFRSPIPFSSLLTATPSLDLSSNSLRAYSVPGWL